MSKRILFIGCLILLVGVAGAFLYVSRGNEEAADGTQNSSQGAESKDVREAVWEQLSDKQQERIAWHDGKISKITLSAGATISDGTKIIKVKQYAGKEVYLIDFPTDSMAVPNNMIVYADIDTFAIIGYGLVD